MTCVTCKHGETQPGMTNVVLQRNSSTIIFKNVPSDICNNCGEYYLSEAVTGDLLVKAEDAIKKGTEIEILKYAA